MNRQISKAWQHLNEVCDFRIVALGLSLIALSRCTSESQSSSSPLLGVYVQVDRVGRPGVKEIFESFADHETTNRNSPITDNTLPAAISNFMTTPNSTLGGPGAASATTMQHVFIPDEIQADLSATSGAYLDIEAGNATFGGRGPADPAMETDLKAIYGQSFDTSIPATPCLQTDGLNTAPTTPSQPSTFPYII